MPIVEFIGFRSKMYSYVKDNGKNEKTAKGVRKNVIKKSSSTGLFTHYCYANEVGRHTKPSKFWSDDGIQRTP